MLSQLRLMMRFDAADQKACTERLYSVTMMVLFSSGVMGRMPMAAARSITGRVWPRRWTTPQIIGWRLGIWVRRGSLRTPAP